MSSIISVEDLQGTLRSLQREIVEINRANGWKHLSPLDWVESDTRVPAALALLQSEVSEALEAFREDSAVNFAVELADVLIRLLDLADGLEIDLAAAVLYKLKKNRERGLKHGGKRI